MKVLEKPQQASSMGLDEFHALIEKRRKEELKAVEEMSKQPFSLEQIREQFLRNQMK